MTNRPSETLILKVPHAISIEGYIGRDKTTGEPVLCSSYLDHPLTPDSEILSNITKLSASLQHSQEVIMVMRATVERIVEERDKSHKKVFSTGWNLTGHPLQSKARQAFILKSRSDLGKAKQKERDLYDELTEHQRYYHDKMEKFATAVGRYEHAHYSHRSTSSMVQPTLSQNEKYGRAIVEASYLKNFPFDPGTNPNKVFNPEIWSESFTTTTLWGAFYSSHLTVRDIKYNWPSTLVELTAAGYSDQTNWGGVESHMIHHQTDFINRYGPPIFSHTITTLQSSSSTTAKSDIEPIPRSQTVPPGYYPGRQLVTLREANMSSLPTIKGFGHQQPGQCQDQTLKIVCVYELWCYGVTTNRENSIEFDGLGKRTARVGGSAC
ncbi:hypothetical protein TREMEDRAFT_63995 [Tremella mesenterica DSM 1558]|uniref:uncharacterized protein n=1 Tax=Tremella mesenterica (strain ATCC 24925 / CBS 8224 / DSM 1558 / NBRC 9311 / NRRL Y-6157 / RJB 2259-6 / UBC 559-6) TaxID=578456 RepID=UPI0003F49780|nr:uncharacterized protein TREMEDRAFT_63995 [Tremella mesenterica DSM 1558]EIW68101.1 hypothetical protein TREMEDRAFT_63995 [Tremella mesenterica DSM 1558]